MNLSPEANRLVQEASCATSRSEIERLIRNFDFRRLSAEQREALCTLSEDIINELSEDDL